MIGEVESKGGPTLEGSLLGETAKHHEVDWLHEADKATTSSLETPYCRDSSGNIVLMSVEMKAHLPVRLNSLLQGCTTLVCCSVLRLPLGFCAACCTSLSSFAGHTACKLRLVKVCTTNFLLVDTIIPPLSCKHFLMWFSVTQCSVHHNMNCQDADWASALV